MPGSEAELYERDFHAWTFEQARKIRSGEPIDIENVAEELEDLGRSQQQQLRNRMAVLLTHLLKWEFQPDKRSASWKATIEEQRRRINRLIGEMPSLRAYLPEAIVDAYETAVTFAAAETMMVPEDLPSECPYTLEQIMNAPFLPGAR
jgi:hypothetical protein